MAKSKRPIQIVHGPTRHIDIEDVVESAKEFHAELKALVDMVGVANARKMLGLKPGEKLFNPPRR